MKFNLFLLLASLLASTSSLFAGSGAEELEEDLYTITNAIAKSKSADNGPCSRRFRCLIYDTRVARVYDKWTGNRWYSLVSEKERAYKQIAKPTPKVKSGEYVESSSKEMRKLLNSTCREIENRCVSKIITKLNSVASAEENSDTGTPRNGLAYPDCKTSVASQTSASATQSATSAATGRKARVVNQFDRSVAKEKLHERYSVCGLTLADSVTKVPMSNITCNSKTGKFTFGRAGYSKVDILKSDKNGQPIAPTLRVFDQSNVHIIYTPDDVNLSFLKNTVYANLRKSCALEVEYNNLDRRISAIRWTSPHNSIGSILSDFNKICTFFESDIRLKVSKVEDESVLFRDRFDTKVCVDYNVIDNERKFATLTVLICDVCVKSTDGMYSQVQSAGWSDGLLDPTVPVPDSPNSACSRCRGLGNVESNVTCSECKGKGHQICTSCKGRGWTPCSECKISGKSNAYKKNCNSCHRKRRKPCYCKNGLLPGICFKCYGKGKIGVTRKCPSCNGSGEGE